MSPLCYGFGQTEGSRHRGGDRTHSGTDVSGSIRRTEPFFRPDPTQGTEGSDGETWGRGAHIFGESGEYPGPRVRRVLRSLLRIHLLGVGVKEE